MLRSIPALAGLVLATSSIAQEGSNIVVFLKSPYYAEVEQTARGTGEKTIDSSWCRPGANLARFPWADEFELVGRGNNPLPLAHAIMADPNGRCEYFVVYTSRFAVLPDLAKRLATWVPALTTAREGLNSMALKEPPTHTVSVPPPRAAGQVVQPEKAAGLAVQPEKAAGQAVQPEKTAGQVVQSEQQAALEDEPPPLPRPKPPIVAIKRNPVPPKPRVLAPAAPAPLAPLPSPLASPVYYPPAGFR